jgi:uncharacterized protein YkwD
VLAVVGTSIAPESAAAASPDAHGASLCRVSHARKHGHPARRHHRHHGHATRRHRGRQARRHWRARCSVRSLHRARTHGAGRRPTAGGVDLASLASSNCPDTTLVPGPSDLDRARSAIFCLINRERARAGEDPLRSDFELRAAAQHHSDDMLARDYFDHNAPGGETLLDRMRSSGYLYSSHFGYVIGENIAWGTLALGAPKAIVEAWMASAGHRANILDASFRDTGIGVAAAVPGSLGEGQAGATYTQEFGVIIKG